MHSEVNVFFISKTLVQNFPFSSDNDIDNDNDNLTLEGPTFVENSDTRCLSSSEEGTWIHGANRGQKRLPARRKVFIHTGRFTTHGPCSAR